MSDDPRFSKLLIALVVFAALAALFGQVVVQNWPPKDGAALLYSLLTSITGTFVGAGLAFMAHRSHERNKLDRENIAAGRVALLTMSGWINDFVVYRAGVIGTFARKNNGNPMLPPWHFAHPHAYHFDDSLKIDFKALAFLYEGKSYPEMYGRTRLAETAYFDLKARNSDMLATALALQQLMAKHFGSAPVHDLREVEQEAGPELIARASDQTVAIVARLGADAEGEFVTSFEVVRAALATRYPDAQFPRFGGIPESKRLENLPPIPPSLLTALH
jgi:hypothetical protein